MSCKINHSKNLSLSSGVVWEHCKQKGRKHRPFTQSQTELLEKCYQLYQTQLKTMPDASFVESHFVITRNLEVSTCISRWSLHAFSSRKMR